LVYPHYGPTLEVYRRVVEQKNKLLRDDALSEAEKGRQIRIWNQQLVLQGAKVVITRLRFLSELRPVVGMYYNEVAGVDAEITLRYVSRCQFEEGMDEEAAGDVLQRELDQNLDRELMIGQSIRGPHRDDVLLAIDGREARDYASEGQVRSLAICLKLAVRDLLARAAGEDPVLLVDDVGSELDPERRDRAVRLLAEKGQVFMACQDRAAFAGALADRMAEAAIWEIQDGTVTVTHNG
jgi:DNA replication and repair protein RecF